MPDIQKLALYSGGVGHWLGNDVVIKEGDFKMSYPESIADSHSRFKATFERLAKTGPRPLLIVTHGGSIAA